MPGLTTRRAAKAGLALLPGLLLAGCLEIYPEVAVTNLTRPDLLLRGVSFQGQRWEGVLGYAESTGSARCVPGEGRLRFEKHDPEDGDFDERGEPMWFPYQTRSTHGVGYGESHRLEITLEGMEQDFSAPSPYGH